MEQRKSEQWYSKLFRIINSGVCFALAYLIYTYLYWFIMAIVAKVYDFDAFVYYYGIKFILNNHEWHGGKISLIYLSAPVACLMLGFLCLYFYNKIKDIRSMLNIFLMWGFIIGVSIFLAQIVIAVLGTYEYGSSFYQGLAVVFSWWGIPDIAIYLLIVPFVVLLIYFSVNYAKPFLLFSYSYTKVNKLSRRRKYFFETAMVPFLMGGMVATANTFPMNISIHAIYLITIGVSLVIAWISLSYIEVLKEEIIRFKSFQHLNFLTLFLLGLMGTFIFITFRGIYIG